MLRGGLVLLMGLLAIGEAQACQRCGRFGNLCRFVQPVQHHVVKPAVAYAAPAAVAVPVAQYQTPDVFVVQNNYPQPNGAVGLLSQQGNSVYGLQAASAQYFVSPTEFLRQSAELSKAALATASLGISSYNLSGQTQLTLQANIAEPLAKGQAASQVLAAAGLSQSSSQQVQSLALRITQGSNGQWQVSQVDPGQVNAQVQVQAGGVDPVPPAPAPPSQAGSVLAGKCVRCHGTTLAEPGGGLNYDQGHKLSAEQILRAMEAVDDGKMPKGGPRLTAQESYALWKELRALQTIEEPMP